MCLHQRWRSGGEKDAEAGVAVLLALGVLSLVLALTSVLVLTSTVESRLSARARDTALAQSAAETALGLVMLDLRTSDWDTVLGGALSHFSDGPPFGVRSLAGVGAIDLTGETNDLMCGRTAACSDSDVARVADGRPWGSRNPRWRLYAYGPLGSLFPGPAPPPVYVAVWVADDPADGDGDPSRDALLHDDWGHQVVLVAARAWGPGGTRRSIQASVLRSGTELRFLTSHDRDQ